MMADIHRVCSSSSIYKCFYPYSCSYLGCDLHRTSLECGWTCHPIILSHTLSFTPPRSRCSARLSRHLLILLSSLPHRRGYYYRHHDIFLSTITTFSTGDIDSDLKKLLANCNNYFSICNRRLVLVPF